MEIIIKSLKLENFKGIKDLSIDFKDDVTNIFGDNGIGKTTIFDAFTWLLWDKDSLSRKDFSIKPYDKTGEEIHNLESTVEGELVFGDVKLNLKKIYKEIWTKKRGSTTEEFTGHTTDYYINSVPKKKKEYNEQIGSVLSEENFNLLSNPLYFNQVLDKTKRRDVVLGLIDEVDLKDVVKANEKLKELDLENYNVDEIRKMAKDSARKINKDIESIPARIDELNKSKVQDIDFETLEFRKNNIVPAIRTIDNELSGANEVLDLVKKITEEISNLSMKRLNLKAEYDDRASRRLLSYERDLKQCEYLISQYEKEIEIANKDLNIFEEKIAKCRKDWEEVYRANYEGGFLCPTCGREFQQKKKGEILEKFNRGKACKLEDIELYVVDIKKDKQLALERKAEYFKRLKEIKLKKESLIKPEETEKEYPKEYFELEEIIKQKEEELKAISTVEKDELLEKKDKLSVELEDINKKLSLKGQDEKLDERIKVLEKEEKDLAKAYEEQQKIIYLCDEYTKTYVDLVSEKINKLFKEVKFKLFDRQINGGITETCEVTLNGVPYSDLNSAGKINAGLDVIKTISSRLDLKVPIFIDNAESVNELVKTDTQLARLVVSKDKVIKVD